MRSFEYRSSIDAPIAIRTRSRSASQPPWQRSAVIRLAPVASRSRSSPSLRQRLTNERGEVCEKLARVWMLALLRLQRSTRAREHVLDVVVAEAPGVAQDNHERHEQQVVRQPMLGGLCELMLNGLGELVDRQRAIGHTSPPEPPCGAPGLHRHRRMWGAGDS